MIAAPLTAVLTCAQSQNEKEETFALTIANNLQDAVNKVVDFLGLAACDKSGKVATDKNTHTLYLSVQPFDFNAS